MRCKPRRTYRAHDMTNASESKTTSRGNDLRRWRRRASGRARPTEEEAEVERRSRVHDLIPSSSRLSLSLCPVARKRGTARRPVRGRARTVSSRVAYESLHFSPYLLPRAAATFLIRGPWRDPLVKAEGHATKYHSVIGRSYDTLLSKRPAATGRLVVSAVPLNSRIRRSDLLPGWQQLRRRMCRPLKADRPSCRDALRPRTTSLGTFSNESAMANDDVVVSLEVPPRHETV